MTAVCSATKRNGEPCTLPARGSNGYCWAHDPANRERRSKMASRAGKARHDSTTARLRDVRASVRKTVDDVLSGSLDPKRAAVAFQGFNTLLRTFDLEGQARLEELENELTELEREIHAR